MKAQLLSGLGRAKVILGKSARLGGTFAKLRTCPIRASLSSGFISPRHDMKAKTGKFHCFKARETMKT